MEAHWLALPRRGATVFAMALCLLSPIVARAHGEGMHRGIPGPEVSGVERGAAYALNCDHLIHELLFEYAYCIRTHHPALGADPEAQVAFWFVAWVRASVAQANGYADADPFEADYRTRFLSARRHAPVSLKRLCAEVFTDCSTLPVAVPEEK